MNKPAKKIVSAMMLLAGSVSLIGCARPGEVGWGVAYSSDERGKLIVRNWDYEGKQIVDDIDHILLLRPATTLTEWNLR